MGLQLQLELDTVKQKRTELISTLPQSLELSRLDSELKQTSSRDEELWERNQTRFRPLLVTAKKETKKKLSTLSSHSPHKMCCGLLQSLSLVTYFCRVHQHSQLLELPLLTLADSTLLSLMRVVLVNVWTARAGNFSALRLGYKSESEI
jgi:hypothetical protein